MDSKINNLKIYYVFTLAAASAYPKSNLKTVGIGIVAPLAIGNTTSSERYRHAFESSLYYSIGKNETKLNNCGYKLQVHREYYPKSHPQI